MKVLLTVGVILLTGCGVGQFSTYNIPAGNTTIKEEPLTPIKEVYPNCQRETYFSSPYDYYPLIKSLGYDVLMKVDDVDYQGDSRFLLKKGNKFGLLIFGWGSCSGCDALQACESYEAIEDLRDLLHDQIVWKDSAKELLHYIKAKDWQGTFAWHAEETKQFVDGAIVLLTDISKGDKDENR